METISKQSRVGISFKNKTDQKSKTKSKVLSEFWKDAEFYRFGIIPMLLTIVAIISGVAAAFGAKGDATKLCMVAFPTMFALTAILSVSPMKLIFYASVIALIMDLLVLTI